MDIVFIFVYGYNKYFIINSNLIVPPVLITTINDKLEDPFSLPASYGEVIDNYEFSDIEGKAAPVSNSDNGFKYLHIIQMEDANSLDAVQL